MRRNGGQIVCEALLREGVDVIFGLPGGRNPAPLPDPSGYPELRHIWFVMSRGLRMLPTDTRALPVAPVSHGPPLALALTNLVTGIATAQMDSVPMVVITGQVGRAAIGSDAFQKRTSLESRFRLRAQLPGYARV